MAESHSEFAEMAVRCLELRLKLPPRLWAEFAVIEEAALRASKPPAGFRCNPDESAGLAEVFELEERRR